ncbi:MAG: vanadium-dependent haloperoxidase, partial [Verrucomicrobiota bacterium]
VDFDIESRSVARLWNEFLLEAIRKDFPDPTQHGRNLYHVSAAMWDAFWAYDIEGWSRATPAFHQEVLTEADWGGDREAAQRKAISYAAYQVLLERYKNSVGREESYFGFRWLMGKLGYDPDFMETVGNDPAAVGNRIGQGLLAIAVNDGSNEANGYADTSGYSPSNDPLVFKFSGTDMDEPNLWQPLAFDFLVTQNGIPIGEDIQEFIGVNWREVDTFAIEKDSSNTIAIDPGPPPLFGTETEPEFRESAVEVIRFSSCLDPATGTMINISPSGRLNNRLGKNEGTGRALNPVTGQRYADNFVNFADYGRILAEFWADGPSSETPPGHWNALHNEITEGPLFERKYGGRGEELSKLEWDIQAYLALNGGMHDAAVAAWTLKRQYDYVRPISIIRYLASLGQSSDPLRPSYHPNGLPLETDLIEVITAESSAVGERHEHLADYLGEIAIWSWAGEPEDTENEVGGVEWIRAADWRPYQRRTFVTPAFAAYVSGHSTFSRAGAEVMALLTGTPFFPGGIGEFHFEKNEYLEFEQGPSEDVTLQWATYYDAADQAGISRLYGGIHVRADDFVGRELGARIGMEAFLKAHSMRSGGSPTDGLLNVVVEGRQQPSSEFGRFAYSRMNESQKSLPILRASSLPEAFPDVFEQDGLVYVVLEEDGGFTGSVLGEELRRFEMRMDVDAGDAATIRFSIKGVDPEPVLVRALGPSYESVPLDQRMGDTVIELYAIGPDDSETLIAENDNWIESLSASLIQVAAEKEGIDNLDHGSLDSGLFAQLTEGDYRIEVSGVGGIGGTVMTQLLLIESN